MAFATISDVKEHAIFKTEISELTDPQIQRLLNRAQRLIIARVGSAFVGETNPDVLFDLNVVTVFMVDKLFVTTRPENAEDGVIGLSGETIQERSYTLSKDKTFLAAQFEEEFLNLIAGLKARVGTRRPIFEVGRGPSYRGDDES